MFFDFLIVLARAHNFFRCLRGDKAVVKDSILREIENQTETNIVRKKSIMLHYLEILEFLFLIFSLYWLCCENSLNFQNESTIKYIDLLKRSKKETKKFCWIINYIPILEHQQEHHRRNPFFFEEIQKRFWEPAWKMRIIKLVSTKNNTTCKNAEKVYKLISFIEGIMTNH